MTILGGQNYESEESQGGGVPHYHNSMGEK
jgi:hypothetical protein